LKQALAKEYRKPKSRRKTLQTILISPIKANRRSPNVNKKSNLTGETRTINNNLSTKTKAKTTEETIMSKVGKREEGNSARTPESWIREFYWESTAPLTVCGEKS
jgi:hypothetical protein